MRYLLVLLVFIFGCNGNRYVDTKVHWTMKNVSHETIEVDSFWMPIVGFDSLEIISNYEGTKLHINYCYPNKWEFNKFKKDTVFIHNTYTSKNYGNVENIFEYLDW